MATKIRLKRIGRRNRPFYRVIVIDSRKRRDGAAIEELGWYNPIDSADSYKLDEERIMHWLGEGAQVSDTVHSLFQKAGISFKWHLKSQGLDEKAVEKELKKWQLKMAEKAKQDAAAKAKPKPKKAEPAAEAVSEEKTEEATPKEEPAAVEEKPVKEEKASEEPVVVEEKPVKEEKSSEKSVKAEEAPVVADVQDAAAEEKAEDEQQKGEE